MGKRDVKQYSSFAEAAKDFGCKPARKRTKNEQKLNSQRERFYKRHLCSACGQPMRWVNGTNVMCCSNPDCNGIPVTVDAEEGAATKYLNSFDILDTIGADIANNILD